MILIDRYTARINLHGTTQRERMKNRTIQNLNRKVPDSLSYKDVLINGVATQLVINSGTQPYYKEFETLPGNDINIGDYVEWADSHWIVETCDSDNELYKDGKMNQCNYLLKWQNERGRIIERWAFIQSASKYNDGTDGNNVVTLGSDQLSVMIPVDKESIKLRKQMGIKFFIDGNKEDPTTYELTGTGNVVDTFNGHGVTAWIVKECAYTPSKDDLRFGVCNYKPPKHKKLLDVIENLNCVIVGKKEMTNRYKRTYKAIFTDDNKNKIENVGFKWIVKSEFPIEQEVNGNEITLYTEDPSHIGESFLLSVQSQGKNVASMEILITEGLF